VRRLEGEILDMQNEYRREFVPQNCQGRLRGEAPAEGILTPMFIGIRRSARDRGDAATVTKIQRLISLLKYTFHLPELVRTSKYVSKSGYCWSGTEISDVLQTLRIFDRETTLNRRSKIKV
jgi:hypothetical protein